MKKMMRILISGMIALVLQPQALFAQKIDEDRMKRDIEVAENVLATLIKGEMNQQRLFGMDIKGTYQPGYGVTFRLPSDYAMPYVVSIGGHGEFRETNAVIVDNGYSYSYRTGQEKNEEHSEKEKEAVKLKEKAKEKKKFTADSLRDEYNKKVIKAAKDFIIDYGDFMSQLAPNEKIIVTNQGDHHHYYFNPAKRTRISVEGSRADITAFKQGKISRDQAMNKLTVVNTETVESKEQDMELLASIFNRLYRSDLSKSYFTQGNVYYERLKDYGVMFYMQVFSSDGDFRYSMPTIGLEDIDKPTRDKKVVELYPKFEQDLKENILEYGRTVKSLKDDEVMVFNVTLTKCAGCGIPSSLELSIKASVLKDFGSAKLDKNAAVAKFTVKKGANQ